MRRRRLNTYRKMPAWPGKDPAWRAEQADYDYFLLLAAEMLEVDGFDRWFERPLTAEDRAVLEDRLGHAGLDVWASDPWMPRGVIGDDEPIS
jgi:hypothetical protein